jgi:hypothetical protein
VGCNVTRLSFERLAGASPAAAEEKQQEENRRDQDAGCADDPWTMTRTFLQDI